MTDTENEKIQDMECSEALGAEAKTGNPDRGHADEPHAAHGSCRTASYVVLFIAAVFLINAMETGSYRTPWPVALGTALAGLGLFGYSWYLQFRSKV